LSISSGDVNGDGKNEIVFIDDRDVYVYLFEGKKNVKLAEIVGRNNFKLLCVDIADVNGNGIDEIFVTNFNKNLDRVFSFVIEWDGVQFEKTAEDLPWYFRAIDVPGRGRTLLGQKKGLTGMFQSGVYEMKLSQGKYVGGQKQDLPDWVNVFSFNYGEVLNNGKIQTVAFSRDDHLKILAENGGEAWQSMETYGGSMVFVDYETGSITRGSKIEDSNRHYLSQRIFVRDTDGNGKNEVIVSKNEDLANRLFSRFRYYNSGYMISLQWDNLGMYRNWRTRKISGHISDYTVNDIDNDGRDEVAFSVVVKTDTVLSDPRSFIVFQQFSPPSLSQTK
jgi:hypothetical protein